MNYYSNISDNNNSSLYSYTQKPQSIDIYFSNQSTLTDRIVKEQNIAMFDEKNNILLQVFLTNARILMVETTSALLVLVLVLATFSASLGVREMYVKALLKIFEYATNIKNKKLKCEDLLHIETEDEVQKRKAINKLHRLRHQSFVLNSEGDEIYVDENDNIRNAKNLNQSLFEKIKSKMGFLSSPVSPNKDNERDYQLDNDSDDEIDKLKADSKTKTRNESTSKIDELPTTKPRSLSDIKKNFQLGDIMDFVNKGIDTIIDDDVTKRFTTEELAVWNLLTRTNQQYEYVSFRVTVLWFLGFILRYCILFPFRLLLFFFACGYTLLSTYIIGLLPDGRLKRWANRYGMKVLHRILSRVFSAIIRFHNHQHKAKPGSICVANHTSPIDVIILSTDNTYSLIGQQHGGFTGMMQNAFSRASNHIWFDRSETKDRSLVSKRMRAHTENKQNCPILIFPEGTCINNTSVMMFKKGCFEIGATIYPVAIKYDSRFGDAFWNSQKHSMLQYLILMMTSWAIVVDVYYLPPMERGSEEDVMTFTNRVKAEIVKTGSFADLNWDGMLKRDVPKLDLMYQQQKKFVSQLKID